MPTADSVDCSSRGRAPAYLRGRSSTPCRSPGCEPYGGRLLPKCERTPSCRVGAPAVESLQRCLDRHTQDQHELSHVEPPDLQRLVRCAAPRGAEDHSERNLAPALRDPSPVRSWVWSPHDTFANK